MCPYHINEKILAIKNAMQQEYGFKPFEGNTMTKVHLQSSLESNNPKDLLGVKKPSIGLIPPSALILESEAFKDGANKYGAYNYRKTKVKATVYIDAALRHLLSYLDGEQVTRDSGVDHRAAVRACMAILIDSEQTGNLIDDRPSKGTASDLIEVLTKEKV